MVSICLYFQVHQPYRLRRYSIFELGNSSYFDEEKNKEIFLKIAHKCYFPMNALLLELLTRYPAFKVSFSFSGVFLDQCISYCPELLQSFLQLVATGRVEILSETYYHSLAFLYSPEEFIEQILLHKSKIQKLFGVTPQVLRNTELIYHNDLAAIAKKLGFLGMLMEGADKVLGWRSPNFVYQAQDIDISLLLKNYRLSDDVAFRFSEKHWIEYPLTASKFASWVNATHGNGETINLFMDYETFGEHQWASSGIFDFMMHLPAELLHHPQNSFATPSEVIKQYRPVGELDVPYYLSWADTERDLSAWVGNDMQRAALQKLYSFEAKVKNVVDASLLSDWRMLQTSDHFYYMCTKWFSDGDVHKYFNPYQSPYEGFVYFMNIMKDFDVRVAQRSDNCKDLKHDQCACSSLC